MARNSEKAQAMLNRYVQAKRDEAGTGGSLVLTGKRPYLASQCNDLKEADQWRRQVRRDISRKMTSVQNASLPEAQLRQLNDEINRLFREQWHWNQRVIELGGPNHHKKRSKILDADGTEVSVVRGGYMYFGATRNLPAVKRLLEESKEKVQMDKETEKEERKRARQELYRAMDTDYFGYRDDDDGVLVKVEQTAERKLVKAAMAKWQKENEERIRAGASLPQSHVSGPVALPSQDELSKALLEEKKKKLLQTIVGS